MRKSYLMKGHDDMRVYNTLKAPDELSHQELSA